MPSKFLKHEPCPNCNSKDNFARYDDGHGHCFGCGHQEQPPKDNHPPRIKPMAPPTTPLLEFLTHRALDKRGISLETCKLFNYGYSQHQGAAVQVAEYRNQKGDVVAQHLRYRTRSSGGWVTAATCSCGANTSGDRATAVAATCSWW